ncbi:MAG: NfeD family protein [Nevskiaceae bacterium]|jgi:membrane protein implicated in regulation of membrane protease activity|nr:NfeD family protein [Nevskiaceae bacterium]
MLTFAQSLTWYHWWIAAAVLAIFETFLPGAIAIWFAAAAVVVGALDLVVPIPWQLQLVLFGVLGALAIVLWRRFREPETQQDSDQPSLNRRGAQYVGQVLELVEPIADGQGKVRVADTVWLVRGGDAPVGARVRVTGVDGTALRVESV